MKKEEIKNIQLNVMTYFLSNSGVPAELLEEYKIQKSFFNENSHIFLGNDKKILFNDFTIIDSVLGMFKEDICSKARKILKIQDKSMIEKFIKAFQLQIIALGFNELTEEGKKYYQDMKNVFMPEIETKLLNKEKSKEILDNFTIIENVLKIPVKETLHKLDEVFKIKDPLMVNTLIEQLDLKKEPFFEKQAVLAEAVRKNLPNLAQYVLSLKANPNYSFDSKELHINLVQWAIFKGHSEVLEVLIKNGANSNIVVGEKFDFRSMVSGFVNYFTGKSPEKKSIYLGLNCWHLAALKGDVKSLEVLVKYSDKEWINSGTLLDKYSPLSIAVQYGNVEAVKFLIKNGARFRQDDSYDFVPLYLGVKYNQVEVIKYLFETYPTYKEQFHKQEDLKKWREEVLEIVNKGGEEFKELKALLAYEVVKAPSKNPKSVIAFTPQGTIVETPSLLETNPFEDREKSTTSSQSGNKSTSPSKKTQPKKSIRPRQKLSNTSVVHHGNKNNNSNTQRNNNDKTKKQFPQSPNAALSRNEAQVLIDREIEKKRALDAQEFEEKRKEIREAQIKKDQEAAQARAQAEQEVSNSNITDSEQASETSEIIKQARAEVAAGIDSTIYVIETKIWGKTQRPGICIVKKENGQKLILVGSHTKPNERGYRKFQLEPKGEPSYFSEFFLVRKDDAITPWNTKVRLKEADKKYISELISLKDLQELFPERNIIKSVKQVDNESLLEVPEPISSSKLSEMEDDPRVMSLRKCALGSYNRPPCSYPSEDNKVTRTLVQLQKKQSSQKKQEQLELKDSTFMHQGH